LGLLASLLLSELVLRFDNLFYARIKIDLARSTPKSSRYFTDYVHFTNEGAQEVADIILQLIVSDACKPVSPVFPASVQ
jgi:lysophospholipase L1-like esterase